MERGRTPIKSYYFFRNGMIHHRYTVDDCIRLSRDESERVKYDLSQASGNSPVEKQEILGNYYAMFKQIGKPIEDGCRCVEQEIMKRHR